MNTSRSGSYSLDENTHLCYSTMTKISLQTILVAISKLRGCVNHIKNKNPYGAFEHDILSIDKF
ncbi:hypothetical protein HID58_059919 [Brassica napus]|uniref:Uncharacterized protein n=1 Tax=Brassica napus TaxID=3708 RepID=A0ABQ7ZUZ0_BRANA|nr:hypothetical protein HID58_059919 [Brassica napus]